MKKNITPKLPPKEKRSNVAMGIDPSLTATGYAVLVDGVLSNSGVIKSKPSGDLPIHEIGRISFIVDSIIDIVKAEEPELVAIEGLAFMARNTTALIQLSGLNYMLRNELKNRGIPFIIVAPTTLKKFITGKGNSDKNIMLMEIYKTYGETFLNDNIGDAYGLAVTASALWGFHARELTLPQIEALEVLKKQLT